MSTLDGGQTVGRYRIERFLGAGAMGEVYLAQDPHIERPLAIKTVRLVGRPQEIEDRKKRLLREAKAAGRLLHPNIVTLFDAGEAGDILYLAFEYVEGSDLSTRVGTSPLSLREVLRIIAECAEALDYAHRQGIVHRDIKPSNILLDKAGHVKVADFGIAKMAGQSTELTMAGSVMGSPQYLSPEQIKGEELDGRSDLFSLGVVLFELLSGRRPFDGDTITTLVYQILHKEPPKVSELRGGIPPRLEALLGRMLAKDRDERLATAGLAAQELQAIERELPDDTLSAPAATDLQQQVPTYVLPRRTTAAAQIPPLPTAPGQPAAPTVAAPSPGMPSMSPIPPTAAPAAGGSRKGLWLALGLILLVLMGLGGAGGYFALRYYQRATANPAAGSPAPPAVPAAGGGPTPAPPPAPTPATRPEPKPAEVPVVVGQPIQIRNQPPAGRPPRQEAASAPSAPSPEPPRPAPAPAPAQDTGRRTPPTPPSSGRPAPVPGPSGSPSSARAPESAPEPAPEPARQAEADRPEVPAMKTGLSLSFRVTPPDSFILVDGTVIGRAEEWSGQKGTRPYTLAEAGEHTIKIKKPGMKDYRLTIEASETSGTTPVTVRLQGLPTHEVATADLQSYRVRKSIGFKGVPDGAEVLVDGNPSGPARRFSCNVFGRGGLELAPGTHRVTVSAPGFAQRDLKIEVDDEAESSCRAVDLARGGNG